MEQVLVDEAVFRSLIVDRVGKTHVRLDQLHKGVPVFAGQTIVHIGSNGQVVGVTDDRREVGAVDMTASISAKAAVRELRQTEKLRGRLHSETKLVVYVADTTSLAWYVNLRGLDSQGRPFDRIALVNAHDGGIQLSYDNLQTERDEVPGQAEDSPGQDNAGSPGRDDDDDDDEVPITGLAYTLYSGSVDLATSAYEEGGYAMRDPSRGGSYTTDMLDKRVGDGELYVDEDNLWGDFTNNDRATAGTDAHFGLALTWDYYLRTHDRLGIYEPGKGILSRVHFGNDYVNAYWSAACQCVTYGDGDGVTASPLVSIDIIAHELTHGVTAATADLIYTGQSGGLNESMSDIFATAVEFYAADFCDTIPEYWAGEDVWTPEIPGDALRYLDDPTRDGRSIDHYDDYTPGMDVHFSSGLANHVFYLLSEGGPHASTGELVTAIGRDQAEQVFYLALTGYMTPETNFAGAKQATMQAAIDLYDSETAQLVGAAWEACGVD
jgi:Zn-dependent metalloprotease